jgi:hypothetical protein
MSDNRMVTAALTVDLEGVRAKYECLLCRTVEGPVYGIDDVTAFAKDIRTAHPARCTGVSR